MLTFTESKMTFSFPEDDVYRIEKSDLLSKVHLKATECVVWRNGRLVFVEAKCSSPRPQRREEFDQFISDITEKFVHSITFYNAVMLRHAEELLPKNIKKVDLRKADYSFVLVIHGHQLSWLPPLMDALKSKMCDALRLWNVADVNVKVINDELALGRKLIVESQT